MKKFYKVKDGLSAREVYGQDIVDGKVRVDWENSIIAYAYDREEAFKIADLYDAGVLEATNIPYNDGKDTIAGVEGRIEYV